MSLRLCVHPLASFCQKVRSRSTTTTRRSSPGSSIPPKRRRADKVMPLGERHQGAARYLGRLTARPSFARVVEEARPHLDLFPVQT